MDNHFKYEKHCDAGVRLRSIIENLSYLQVEVDNVYSSASDASIAARNAMRFIVEFRDMLENNLYLEDSIADKDIYHDCAGVGTHVRFQWEQDCENVCIGCLKPCCDGCSWWIDGECAHYEYRPDACRVFPWVYNPYKCEFQCLRTCPRWQYFEAHGCPDPDIVKEITMRGLDCV